MLINVLEFGAHTSAYWISSSTKYYSTQKMYCMTKQYRYCCTNAALMVFMFFMLQLYSTVQVQYSIIRRVDGITIVLNIARRLPVQCIPDGLRSPVPV